MESIALTCQNACPVCCEESVAEINAKADAQLRNRSLTLSTIVAIGMLGSHVGFSWFGKALVIPDVVWAIVMGPWLGAAGSKIVDFVDLVKSKKK